MRRIKYASFTSSSVSERIKRVHRENESARIECECVLKINLHVVPRSHLHFYRCRRLISRIWPDKEN